LAAFTGPDGAKIKELAGRSTGLESHSLAIITHPAGTASVAHHHAEADEIYLVWSGLGRIQLDGLTRPLAAGDVVEIRPGQRHKLWNDGPDDLVLVVTCAPAYRPEEVTWDE
jgi:mannose-6-phosphate isomerase-like protein (cupin superfamily)